MKSQQLFESSTRIQEGNSRVIFLDVLRGAAVLGIYWINIVIFADDANEFFDLGSDYLFFDTDFFSGFVTDVMIEGTMRGLFSMLFGASAILFLSRVKLEEHGLEVVERYYYRCLLLILFGMIHAYLLLWPFDILYSYGIIGLCLFPLRKIPPKYLFVIGLIILLVGDCNIAERLTELGTLTNDESIIETPIIADNSDSKLSQETWNREQALPVVAESEKEENKPSVYIQLFSQNIGEVITQQTYNLYNDNLYDIGGMMLIGMALLQFGVLKGLRKRRFYLVLMISGYFFGTVVRDPAFFLRLQSFFVWNGTLPQTLQTYNLGRLLITLGHVGFAGFFLPFRPLRPLMSLLATVGRLALTNYIMQTVIALIVFYFLSPLLTHFFAELPVLLVLMLTWLFQIIFSVMWLHYFRIGPLEWVWRSCIFGRVLPIRKQYHPVQNGVVNELPATV